MVLSYVERGVGAGAIAGLAYGAYVALVADPLVHHAEHVASHGEGHEHAAAVSELTTAVVGVAGGVLWGILLGAAFGLAFYLLEPALPGRTSTKALVLAGAGFLTVSGVPWLVLPPAVPGVEQPIATDLRIAAYGGLMVVGAAASASAVLAFERVRSRDRGLGASIAAGALPLVAVGLALPLATPTLVHVGDAPAALVAAFRGVVVLSQAGLWAAIAACFCWIGPIADDSTPARVEQRPQRTRA